MSSFNATFNEAMSTSSTTTTTTVTSTAGLLLVGLLTAAVAVVAQQYKKSKQLPLPPGPPKDPIIGNLRQFPKSHLHDAFTKWQKEYGDIFSLDIMGQHFIVLNTREVAEELFAKRGAEYSNRFTPYIVNIMGFNWATPFQQYDSHHKEGRRILSKGLTKQALDKQQVLMDKEAREFIRDALELKGKSSDPHNLIEHHIARIVLTLTYGETVMKKHGDTMISTNNQTTERILDAMGQFWLVNIFTWLRHIPDWVPGLQFKELGRWGHSKVPLIKEVPYGMSIQNWKNGIQDDCLATRILEDEGPSQILCDTLASLFGGGVDTTLTSIYNAVYALILHPEVQDKIHEEMDIVIGRNRVPTLEDRSKLVYLEAVWQETLRWFPTTSLAIPHTNLKEDEFRGYRIPANSVLWSFGAFMLNDPKVYPNPTVFNPGRFLPQSHPWAPSGQEGPERDIYPPSFGIGRRACPGKYMADRSAFNFLMWIMWAFRMEIPPGREEEIRAKGQGQYRDGPVRKPMPYEMIFKERSDIRETLAY